MSSKLTFNAIAHRSFTLKGNGETVDIFVGKPEPAPAGHWFCPYRIAGRGIEINSGVNAYDGIQALQMVWAILDTAVESHGLELLWGEEPFKGFTQGLLK